MPSLPAAAVFEIQVLPNIVGGVSKSATLGWALSSAAHAAAAIALVALVVYGPELPSLGGRARSKPIALTVQTPKPEVTQLPESDFTAAAPSALRPTTETVEKRDPLQIVDDTHRRYVYHEAPVASSPPMMSRDDTQTPETASASPMTSHQQTKRLRKHSARPPAVASAAQPPSLRITQHATPYDNPRPVHPPEALARGLAGTVVLRLQVDATGRVRKAEVYQSSGHATLDRAAATTALKRWRFHPARAGNKPVAQTIRVPVVFL